MPFYTRLRPSQHLRRLQEVLPVPLILLECIRTLPGECRIWRRIGDQRAVRPAQGLFLALKVRHLADGCLRPHCSGCTKQRPSHLTVHRASDRPVPCFVCVGRRHMDGRAGRALLRHILDGQARLRCLFHPRQRNHGLVSICAAMTSGPYWGHKALTRGICTCPIRTLYSRCYVIYHGSKKVGWALLGGLMAHAASALGVAIVDVDVSLASLPLSVRPLTAIASTLNPCAASWTPCTSVSATPPPRKTPTSMPTFAFGTW